MDTAKDHALSPTGETRELPPSNTMHEEAPAAQKTKIKLPGYDVEYGWKAHTLLIREYCMLQAIESLTNKPEWWRKVRDPEIAARWRAEMLAMDWQQFHQYGDFTPNMADACIAELLVKADMHDATGLTPVLDYSACVLKSDTLLDDDLTGRLIEHVQPLENVPDKAKDWHPGSGGKVLDLVHPSLWPLVFGKSHIMPYEEIGLNDCLRYIGAGEVIPNPDKSDTSSSGLWTHRAVAVSSINFQWLPCNVSISREGKASIKSYINNLHPIKHQSLYPVIEEFISRSLPAWDFVYRWPEEFAFQRLSTDAVGPDCQTPNICKENYDCRPTGRPLEEDEEERDEDEDEAYSDDYPGSERERRDNVWFSQTHPLKLPDAKSDFQPSDAYTEVKTEGFFDEATRIQVIVKLANIHLTPENPRYDGGTWHIEGQQNERICATALYYYDNDNITESRLSFRTSSDSEGLSAELDYMQNDVRSIARTFAVEEAHEASTLQDVGSVTTRQGRAIFFPNLFLHKVEPFELQDKTRPGHRKILALFLVDPKVPIISTANVPPQQRHWWAGEDYVRDHLHLPSEVGQMVLDNVEFPFDEAEAKKIREELMAERSAEQTDFVSGLESVEFAFCEH